MNFLSKVQNDYDLFINYVNKIFQSVSIVYIAFMSAVASLSSLWVPLVYGSKWSGVENIMILGCFPVTEFALLMVFYSALFAVGKAKVVFFQNMINAVVYWGSMFVFVLLGMKEYSIPFANLLAVQSAIILVIYIQKKIGKIHWQETTVFFIISYMLSLGVWLLFKNGAYISGSIGFSVFSSFIAVYAYRRKQTFINIYSLITNKIKG